MAKPKLAEYLIKKIIDYRNDPEVSKKMSTTHSFSLDQYFLLLPTLCENFDVMDISISGHDVVITIPFKKYER